MEGRSGAPSRPMTPRNSCSDDGTIHKNTNSEELPAIIHTRADGHANTGIHIINIPDSRQMLSQRNTQQKWWTDACHRSLNQDKEQSKSQSDASWNNARIIASRWHPSIVGRNELFGTAQTSSWWISKRVSGGNSQLLRKNGIFPSFNCER